MRTSIPSVAGRLRLGPFGVGSAVGLLVPFAPLLAGFAGTFAVLSSAQAAPCSVPSARHRTIQSAVNDTTCTEVLLGERIYAEQLSLNRAAGITIRGVGAGRTVIVSPASRARSTVSTSFLPNFTYVVQVRPGTSATLVDLTIDGFSNARCGERYFGVRFAGASGTLDRVVVENVRGRGSEFACGNIIAVAVTAESSTPVGGATLTVRGATIRGFQQAGLLGNGSRAQLAVENTVLRGAGAQSQLAQTAIQLQAGAGGNLDRVTATELSFTGDPCRGVGTGIKVASASATTITRGVLRGVDRGILLSKNTGGAIRVSKNRFVETLSGILSTDNGATAMGGSPIIEISQNGFVSTKRSTAATVATCFDESGDAIAVRNESDSVISANSAADSSRCAIELLAGTKNLDVKDNQLVRSSRADLEDKGLGNRLSKNLCQTSTPAGLCAGDP
jgi:hypothetical protein